MKGKKNLKIADVIIAEIVAYKIPDSNKLKNVVEEPE